MSSGRTKGKGKGEKTMDAKVVQRWSAGKLPPRFFIQIRVTNRERLPPGIENARPKAANNGKRVRVAGRLVIPPTEAGQNLSLGTLLDDVVGFGYQLVDVRFGQQGNLKDFTGKTLRYLAEFMFIQNPESVAPGFVAVRPNWLYGLRKTLQENTWGVRAYNNPWMVNKKEDGRALCLNLTAPDPLFEEGKDPDSNPQRRKVWARGPDGKQAYPPLLVLFAAARSLAVINGELVITEP